MIVVFPSTTKVKKIKDAVPHLIAVLTNICIASMVEAGLNENDNIVQSVKVDYFFSGDDLNLILELADYWRYINDGRKPYPNRGVDTKKQNGFYASIRQWVIKKRLQRFFKDAKGRFMATNDIAYMICKSINRVGIKAREFFSDIYDQFVAVTKSFVYETIFKILLEDLKINLS